MAMASMLIMPIALLLPNSTSLRSSFASSGQLSRRRKGWEQAKVHWCKENTKQKMNGQNSQGRYFLRVSSQTQEDEGDKEEPILLRIGVSVVTELLRLFSFGGSQPAPVEVDETSAAVESQDVLELLREDYRRAYFLTGDFTTALYTDNCLFADPTIQFSGRDKYQRNLKLLVPFFEEPLLTLYNIEDQGMKGDSRSIEAQWNLRPYLRLPWKPLIEVDGSTLYVINAESKGGVLKKILYLQDISLHIVKHVESWSITGGQAIQQLFVASDKSFFRKKVS